MEKVLAKYKLPKKVKVVVQKTREGGFMVEFSDLPGCFTQVEDLSQLGENITDAVLTYFDVPRREAHKMIYAPETKVTHREVATKSHPGSTRARFDLFVAA